MRLSALITQLVDLQHRLDSQVCCDPTVHVAMEDLPEISKATLLESEDDAPLRIIFSF